MVSLTGGDGVTNRGSVLMVLLSTLAFITVFSFLFLLLLFKALIFYFIFQFIFRICN